MFRPPPGLEGVCVTEPLEESKLTGNKVFYADAMLPSGLMLTPKLTPKLWQNIKPASALHLGAVEAQLAHRMAALELEHAHLSFAHSLMQLQSMGMDAMPPPQHCQEQQQIKSPESSATQSDTRKSSFVSNESRDTVSTASPGCFSDESSDESVDQTTLMVRNIPNSLTRMQLLEIFDKAGFKCYYDLFYLPIDLKNQAGLGYAFINFVNHKSAVAFSNFFSGFSSWGMQSEKVCEVTWSQGMQGLHVHIEKYRDCPVMHESVPDEFRPILFKNGKRLSFPPPTKVLRAPRIWSRRR
jgi:hypothetical protein